MRGINQLFDIDSWFIAILILGLSAIYYNNRRKVNSSYIEVTRKPII